MQAGFLLPLAIPEGDNNYDDKADIVELNGLQESYEFTLHPDRPPDKEMIAFLRLINISGACGLQPQYDALLKGYKQRIRDHILSYIVCRSQHVL